MSLYFQANFNNLIITNVVNSLIFDYHHDKHLQYIHAAHADNEQDSVLNNNMNWISAHELNWTYILCMLNTDADQQTIIFSDACNIFSVLEIRCRAYTNYI